MKPPYPENWDELDILAHWGATPDELARRLAEREAMSQLERWHVDSRARAGIGPTLLDHRQRWATADGTSSVVLPLRRAEPRPAARDTDVIADPVRVFDPAPDAVPVGTVVDVIDWVGPDPARARAARDAERARERPRRSLLAALGRIADA